MFDENRKLTLPESAHDTNRQQITGRVDDSLRTRVAAVIAKMNDCWCEDCNIKPDEFDLIVADAVIRELTDAIPPIVATAIQGFVESEWAAISHHGEAGEYEMLKRLDREALQIARYATTHKEWNG